MLTLSGRVIARTFHDNGGSNLCLRIVILAGGLVPVSGNWVSLHPVDGIVEGVLFDGINTRAVMLEDILVDIVKALDLHDLAGLYHF